MSILQATYMGYGGLAGYPSSKTTFSYTGSDQTYNVPAGVTKIRVKMWGAAGGSDPNGHLAGAGGYIAGEIAVTPGESLTVIVGQGGTVNAGATRPYGGGGASNNTNGQAGAGGGRCAIRRSSAELCTAGSGGGTYGVNGGDAGGTTGSSVTNGDSSVCGGGSQVAGGSAGTNGNAGAQFQGGDGVVVGGGGGGGYYGGGSADGSITVNGGGGGSSYTGGMLDTPIPTNTAASANTPPNTTDPDYGNNAGKPTGGAAGGNGLVVIY